VLETEKQLQLVTTNPRWQSSSYLCSYIVARVISLLTFFRGKSLHCTNCVATTNLAVGYVEISVYGRIRCIALEYDRILRGGSRSHIGCSLIPHMWDQPANENFFSHEIFNHFMKINPTVCLYLDRGTNDCYSC